MPSIKLTKQAINRLRAPDPSGKQVLMWDTELRGFGLLISGASNARTYVAQRTLPDGRTRRVTIGRVGEIDVADARSEAADLIHMMRKGQDPKAGSSNAAGDWSLRKTLIEYIATRKSLSPASAAYYKQILERHCGDWLDRAIRGLTPDEVEQRHRAIAARLAAKRAPKAHFASTTSGGHTANMAIRLVGTLWNFVADRDATLGANPVRRLKGGWFKEGRRTRLVREGDLAAFYRAVMGLANPVGRDYILTLLFSGMRKTETASLTWNEVDFASRVIAVPGAKTKSGEPLDLPMTPFLSDLLSARRAIGVVKGGWVFPSLRGGHISEVDTFFAEIGKASGITVSAHDLRRSYITVAESCDVPTLALKGLLNHALDDSNVTEGYVRMNVHRLREPADRVAKRLAELCEIVLTKEAAE